MSFSSFSLQSTLALSDPRWGAQALLYFYVFWVVLGFVPWWENLGKIRGVDAHYTYAKSMSKKYFSRSTLYKVLFLG